MPEHIPVKAVYSLDDLEGMEHLEWRSLSDVIEHPISWDLDVFYLLGGDYPESSPGAWVTPGYIHALGIRAELGRTLIE